jgi:hypothetical protein
MMGGEKLKLGRGELMMGREKLMLGRGKLMMGIYDSTRVKRLSWKKPTNSSVVLSPPKLNSQPSYSLVWLSAICSF